MRNDFIYVGIDPDFKPAVPGATALVKVNYFDGGPRFFSLHYSNSIDAYATSDIVRLTGGNMWRTHAFPAERRRFQRPADTRRRFPDHLL